MKWRKKQSEPEPVDVEGAVVLPPIFEPYFEAEPEPEWKNRIWRGCWLVNPLCPDDLCVLPPGHRGNHLLMTMAEPMPLNEEIFIYSRTARTETDLIREGWEAQRRTIAEEEARAPVRPMD